MAQSAHRSGPMKQANKSHKTGGHRSKGMVDNQNRGRISSISSGGIRKAKHAKESKIARKNKLKQVRNLKQSHVLEFKKSVSTGAAPPILVALISLDPNLKDDLTKVFETFLKNENTDWQFAGQGHVQSASKFKRRFHFVQPDPNDTFAILDTTKVCDSIVFVMGDSVDPSAERIVRCVLSQGLPSLPVFTIYGNVENDKHKKHFIKDAKKWIESVCPNASERLCMIQNAQQVQQLFRQIGDQKRFGTSALRSFRPHLMAEKVDCDNSGAKTAIAIEGYVRGVEMNVNRLVHIPGWGDFQVERIEVLADPHPMSSSKRNQDIAMTENATLTPNPELQDDLVCQNEPDPLDADQPDITEDLEEAEANAKKRVGKNFVNFTKNGSFSHKLFPSFQ